MNPSSSESYSLKLADFGTGIGPGFPGHWWSPHPWKSSKTG